MTRIALSLLLVCTCMSLEAREPRLGGANGDGGGSCPDLAATAAAEVQADKPRAGTTPVRTKPVKPATSRGSTDGGRVSAPRWHSFLPGMFR
jgi:hypothetical protein